MCAYEQTHYDALRDRPLPQLRGLIMTPTNVQADAPGVYRGGEDRQVRASAVSWGAIFAGAVVSAALSLILLILGTGLGLSAVSPWAHSGISATTFGASTIVWLTVTQLLAFGVGGYLAGRLRTRWVAVHTDEVYFRDTAHGFLTWAVASLVTATLLTSVIGSIVGDGMQATATLANGVTTAAPKLAAADNGTGPMSYFVESLFRKDSTASATAAGSPERGDTDDGAPAQTVPLSEVAGIFMHTLHRGTVSLEDRQYVSQLVAQRTGVSQEVAAQRVTDTYARMQANLRDAEAAARATAEKMRKASTYAALWLFVSLLCGAFVASFAATYGGWRRDV